MRFSTVVLCLTILVADVAYGQINISTGTGMSENFDGLGTSVAASLPANWRADKQTVVRTVGSWSSALTASDYRAGNNMGSTATNGIYNFGAGAADSATDRALGCISTGTATKSGNIYAYFHNNGPSDITSLRLSYDVEKYRQGTNAAGFSIQLYYSNNGSAWTSAGSSFLTSFAGGDGSNGGFAPAPGVTQSVSQQTLSVTIPSNADFYLAWNYSVTTGSTTSNAQALGIDNVVIDQLLPVELLSFTSMLLDGKIELRWRTATENNNYGFEIQRKLLSDGWHALGFCSGHGTSNTPQNYMFVDNSVPPVTKASYRLKQIDLDGSYSFSNEIHTASGKSNGLTIFDTYPNPAQQSAVIAFSLEQAEHATIRVFDMTGKEIRTLADGWYPAGVHSIAFPAGDVPNGMYCCSIAVGKETKLSRLIIKH